MTLQIRNRCWRWLGALLLAGCGNESGNSVSGDPDNGSNGPTGTCFPTQCDVEYQQCPKPHRLCDQCWDTCQGIDPDLAVVCVRTCTDVCTHEAEDSPCATALALCRSTPKNKLCLEGSDETGGAGSSGGPGASAAPGAGPAAQGGSSGEASAPMSRAGTGANTASASGASGRAGEAAGGADGAPSSGGSSASSPSASGSSSSGGSAGPSGHAGTSGSAGEAPAPHA